MAQQGVWGYNNDEASPYKGKKDINIKVGGVSRKDFRCANTCEVRVATIHYVLSVCQEHCKAIFTYVLVYTSLKWLA